MHTYARTRDQYAALRRAMVFAAYKIGAAGAAEGFPDAAMWEALCRQGPHGSAAFTAL